MPTVSAVVFDGFTLPWGIHFLVTGGNDNPFQLLISCLIVLAMFQLMGVINNNFTEALSDKFEEPIYAFVVGFAVISSIWMAFSRGSLKANLLDFRKWIYLSKNVFMFRLLLRQG
eukprot:GHVQ01025710.1.p1 GENE.GHVQ01025710.1~~GHVQ01025710.1.p1  ORF type:complete len:115 (+),score=7.34 GHVQ01025710.1:515-859(+)